MVRTALQSLLGSWAMQREHPQHCVLSSSAETACLLSGCGAELSVLWTEGDELCRQASGYQQEAQAKLDMPCKPMPFSQAALSTLLTKEGQHPHPFLGWSALAPEHFGWLSPGCEQVCVFVCALQRSFRSSCEIILTSSVSALSHLTHFCAQVLCLDRGKAPQKFLPSFCSELFPNIGRK